MMHAAAFHRAPGLLLGWLCAAVAASLWVATPAAAAAEDPTNPIREAARELAQQGHAHFKRGEWGKAEALLRRAQTLYPAPTITLLRARCLVELGRLVEAASSYEAITRARVKPDEPKAFHDAVKSAARELASLRLRIPRLTILIDGADRAKEIASAGVRVTVNGEALPPSQLGTEHPRDPGSYEIRATSADGRQASERVGLSESARRAVMLRLTPGKTGHAPKPLKSGGGVERALGWSTLGVGAAGIGVGFVAGIHMLNEKASLDAICNDAACPASAKDDLDSFRAARTTSFIGYGIGFAGVGAGLLLLFFAPDEHARSPADRARSPGPHAQTASRSLTPWIGPGSAGLRGVF